MFNTDALSDEEVKTRVSITMERLTIGQRAMKKSDNYQHTNGSTDTSVSMQCYLAPNVGR